MKTLKKFDDFVKESVGELEDNFIDVKNGDSELEVSEKPSGKLKQKTGKIIIENPSKTDAYNAKMSLGGDDITDGDKTILDVKETK